MSCDKLVFDLSQELDSTPSIFIRKDWLNILDNQNSNYNSNQATLDTSQLANSNKYVSYREAYLEVPMLLTIASANATGDIVAGDFAPNATATSADYAIGLKNWFGQIIHSFTLEMGNSTVIQQTPFINMWNSFKLMTSLSWSDIAVIGSTIGFYPDDPLSWTFESVNSLSGRGVCNNTNVVTASQGTATVVQFNRYNSAGGNIGFQKRQQYINYDVDGDSGDSTYADLLPAVSARNLWKSYISKKQNAVATTSQGVFQISIMATIYLRHIHSFFQNIPLLKGAFLKMTMALNNTTTTFTRIATTGVYNLTSVSNPNGGVNPLMLASQLANNGGANAFGGTLGTATLFRANISVGAVCLDSQLSSTAGVDQGTLARSITLYVPSYSFNPIFETAYLSSPVKHIEYEDLYQYQINNISANGGQVNQLVSNGIAGLKSVLILPFYSEQAGIANTGLPIAIPVYQSPFDPAGTGATSPLCLLNNFNVVVSGQNIIYNTQMRAYEQFNNQLYGANAVNGGLTDGLNSGLFNALGFEMEYCYHYVNVGRMLPVEQSVPKSVQIVGTNQSGKAVNLFVFCSYMASVDIDVLTGSRV